MMTYLPTKDEFYDGFEYLQDGKKTIYSSSIIPVNATVKCLDRNDITECGFVNSTTQSANETTSFSKSFLVSGSEPDYVMLFIKDIDGMLFLTLRDRYNHPIFENLHLKNKSEFKWILNRYGFL